MATWRRRALELFPHLRREIQDPEISLYGLFPRLVDEVWKAHDASDHAMLSRIYGYAEWALSHPSKELWNPAAVSFYEHLFLARKDRTDWEKALGLMPITVVRDVWGLWDYFLTADETADILTILKKLGKPFTPPEHERPGNERQRKRDAERRSQKGPQWSKRT